MALNLTHVVVVFFLIQILFTSSYALTISNVNPNCQDPTSNLCEINFSLNTANSTETISPSHWSNFVVSVESLRGTCLFDETGQLVLTSSPRTNIVKCNFEIAPDTYLPQPIQTPEGYILPQLIYFPVPFEFVPISPSCSQVVIDDCIGHFIFPAPVIKSNNLIIKSTSNIVSTSQAVNFVVIDQEELGAHATIYTYQVDLLESTNNEFVIIPSILSKSIISPYLHYFIDNDYKIGESHTPIFHNIDVIPLQNCNLRTGNLCTLVFEMSRYSLGLDELRIIPVTYFQYSLNRDLEPCPESVFKPREDDFIAYCQTFRQTIHSNEARAALNGQIQLHLLSPHMDYEISIPLNAIIYVSPIDVIFDIESCSDITSPVCHVNIISTYEGPPVEAHISIPFGEAVDRITCFTDQFSMTNNAIYFPARGGIPTNQDSWVRKPDHLEYMSCEFIFTLGYKQYYDFESKNEFLTMSSYREGTTTNVRSGLGVSLAIPGGDKIRYSTFPLRLTPGPNCSDSAELYCTLTFSLSDIGTGRTLHPENYPREFIMTVAGIDLEYTFGFNDYSIELVNWQASTVTLSPLLLPVESELNPFDTQLPVFRIDFTHYIDEFDLLTDPDQPALIKINYRKAPDTYLQNVKPYFISYNTLPPSLQPPLDDLFSDENLIKSDGYNVELRAQVSPIFLDNCADTKSLFCTVRVYRWDRQIPRTYFFGLHVDIDDADAVPAPIVGFKDDKTPFDVEYVLIPGSGLPNNIGASLEWSQFKKDPNDLNEELPQAVNLHFRKGIGTNSMLTVTVFQMDSSWEQIRRIYSYTKPSTFSNDGMPIFNVAKCGQLTDPHCAVRYETHNDIPPNYTISIHQLPDNMINRAQIDYCVNINQVDGKWPFAVTVSRAQTADKKGIVRPTDFLTYYNTLDVTVYPIDQSQPIICYVTYVLENGLTRPKYRVEPYVIMDQLQSQARKQSFFLPKMAWSPTIVYPETDCTTHATIVSTCTIVAEFFGSDDSPLDVLYKILPSFYHPLILPGTYNLYSQRIPPEEQEQNEHLKVGTFVLADIPDTFLRRFVFTLLPAFRNKVIKTFLVVKNHVIDIDGAQQTIIVPEFTLPIDLNGVAAEITSNSKIPAMLSGPLIHISRNQSRFDSPGYAQMTNNFRVPVIEMQIKNDIGHIGPLPCVEMGQNEANFEPTLEQNQIRWSLFTELSKLSTRQEQIALLQTWVSENRFINDQITQPRILGWYEMIDEQQKQDEYGDLRTYERHLHWGTNPSFIPIDEKSDSLTNKACYYFIPVNLKFPRLFNNVDHKISIAHPHPRVSGQKFTLYQDYPRYVPSSQLQLLKSSNEIVESNNHNVAHNQLQYTTASIVDYEQEQEEEETEVYSMPNQYIRVYR